MATKKSSVREVVKSPLLIITPQTVNIFPYKANFFFFFLGEKGPIQHFTGKGTLEIELRFPKADSRFFWREREMP